MAAIVGSHVPNLQGAFIRGYGSQEYSQENGSLNGITTTIYSSGNLAEAQGDSIRNIYGSYQNAGWKPDYSVGTGAFSNMYWNSGIRCNSTNPTWYGNHYFSFDASKVVPTSNEVRPINVALLPCIKY